MLLLITAYFIGPMAFGVPWGRIRRRLVLWARKFRGELLLTLASGVAATGVERVLSMFVHEARVVDIVELSVVSGVLVFVVGLSVSIKKNLTWKIEQMERAIGDVYGPRWDNQYAIRSNHFREEKELLAKHLAKTHLGRLLTEWLKSRQDESSKRVVLVIDSGTTLTPLFPRLKYYGFNNARKYVTAIYTNSLSGVEEFNRENELDPEPGYTVTDEMLHLIGGHPLDRYRATTGDETLKAINDLRQSASNALFVGIVTANWIVIDRVEGNLLLCARGRGHYDFKNAVVNACDKIIVVAPLGKILRYDSVDELNGVRESAGEGDRYKALSLSKKDRADVYLLTTTRRHQGSLLYYHAQDLLRMPAASRYQPITEPYDLDGALSFEQQTEIELPHRWLRGDRDRAFVMTPEAQPHVPRNSHVAQRGSTEAPKRAQSR